jgi:hypothetical protein
MGSQLMWQKAKTQDGQQSGGCAQQSRPLNNLGGLALQRQGQRRSRLWL